MITVSAQGPNNSKIAIDYYRYIAFELAIIRKVLIMSLLLSILIDTISRLLEIMSLLPDIISLIGLFCKK